MVTKSADVPVMMDPGLVFSVSLVFCQRSHAVLTEYPLSLVERALTRLLSRTY